MHRRRGNQAVEADNGIQELPTRVRRRQHPRVNGIAAKQQTEVSRVGLAFLLFLLFSSLITVEFLAYRMIGVSTDSDSTTSAANDGVNDNNLSPKQTQNAPTTQPNVTNICTPLMSKQQCWRLKSARRESIEGLDYWKTHAQDPVPELPPDKDPETGEKLPPVIAYVTTLTRCAPNKRGGLDGAAVLLHSIRRNSYGWVPIQQQMNEEGENAKGDNMQPKYGGKGGRYRYRAYVIVDPAASPDNKWKRGECARYLQKLGYSVLHRPPLVPLFEAPIINGVNGTYTELINRGYVGVQRPKSGPTALKPGKSPDSLRQLMFNDGCCGYTELLKLHVYGMVEHELAVHLDFDSLLLRPMDDLFDAMLGKGDEATRSKLPLAKLPRSKEVDLTRPIDAVFTRDYNQVNHPNPSAPVGYQGGFLVVRPSLEVLERYRTILQRGEFLLGSRPHGWGGEIGGFYGDVTFQGILPYYYEYVAPEGVHNEAELDRCIYNQMADNPRKTTYKFPRATPLDPEKAGFRDTKVCRDGRKDCSDTDCQRVHPKDSVTTHFTFCKKPWDCSQGNNGTVASETCLGLLSEWYGIRRELEDWWLLTSKNDAAAAKSDIVNNQQSFYWKDKTISKVRKAREGALDTNTYFGYCDAFGSSGYHRLVEPDGTKI